MLRMKSSLLSFLFLSSSFYSGQLFAETDEKTSSSTPNPTVAKTSEEAAPKEELLAAGGTLGSGGPQPSNIREITPDEIDQVKEILTKQNLKPYSVNIYGLLQANVNFVQTARNNTPDFTVTHARAGVFAVAQNWSGRLELEFIGNQPKVVVPDPGVPGVPTQPYSLLTQSPNGTVTVRQAQINFDFWEYTFGGSPKIAETKPDETKPNETKAKTDTGTKHSEISFLSRVSLGGIRVQGATAVGPDPTYTPSNFGRQDGVYLIENINFGTTTLTTYGFGIFNTLFTTNASAASFFQGWSNNAVGTQPNFLGSVGVTSSTFSKAYLMNAGVTHNFTETASLSAVGYYGFQNRAAVQTNQNGFAITTRDVDHIEASIQYNDTNIFGGKSLLAGNGIAFWFEDEIGNSQVKTSAAPPTFILESDDAHDGYNHQLYGFGIAGDTTKYLTNIIKDTDRFIYAAAITFVNAAFDYSSFSPNYHVTQYTGSFGYGYRTLEFALAASYATSPDKVFAKFDVASNTSGSMYNNFQTYLTAVLFF